VQLAQIGEDVVSLQGAGLVERLSERLTQDTHLGLLSLERGPHRVVAAALCKEAHDFEVILAGAVASSQHHIHFVMIWFLSLVYSR